MTHVHQLHSPDLADNYMGLSDDVFRLYDQVEKIGLLDNMIYDVLSIIPTAVNVAKVGATTITVECDTVPGAYSNPSGCDFRTESCSLNFFLAADTSVTFPLPCKWRITSTTLSYLTYLDPGTLMAAPLVHEIDDGTDLRQTVAIASSIPVLDSAGNIPTSVEFTPSITRNNSRTPGVEWSPGMFQYELNGCYRLLILTRSYRHFDDIDSGFCM